MRLSIDSSFSINCQNLDKNYEINQLEFKYNTPIDICIQSLKFPMEEREGKIIKYISSYIENIPNILNLLNLNKDQRQYNSIMKEISKNLNYKNISKNRFVYKNINEKINIMYIILTGKICILKPKIISCCLTEEEYLSYLIKLRKNNEISILKKTIELNIYKFDVEENFDAYLKQLYEDYFSNPGNLKYSQKTYEKIIEIIKNNKLNTSLTDSNKEITPELFIQSNKLEEENLDSENGINTKIIVYEKNEICEKNQIIIFNSSNNNLKTLNDIIITLEDSDIIKLDLDEYQKILIKVDENLKQKIFDLIYSHTMFMSIPKNLFETRYLSYINYIKFERNEKIYKEGEIIENSILINSGQFIFSINKNLIEINDLIVKLKTIKAKINKISNEILEKNLEEKYENEELIINKKFSIPEHDQIINEKRNITITLIDKSEIIGLNDCVDPFTKKALFNFSCISSNNDAYTIPYDILQVLISKESGVKFEVKKLTNIKLDYYLNRLKQYKKEILGKIKIFDLMNKEKNKRKNHSLPKNDFRKIVNNSIIRRELMLKRLSYKKRTTMFPLPNINLSKFNSFKLNNSIHQNEENQVYLKKLEKMKSIRKILLNRKDKVNQYLEKCKNELEERNRETSILCSYLNESNKYKIIKNKNKDKLNHLNISRSPSLEKRNIDNNPYNSYLRCISSIGKITNYSNGFNSLTGQINQINYIDPLIMDKFNLYYKKGLLKDFSSPNIFTKYQI
jgi:hypothetical protein